MASITEDDLKRGIREISRSEVCTVCPFDYSCCYGPVGISEEDVKNGIKEGYMKGGPPPQMGLIATDEDGLCIYHNRETHKCDIYSIRPKACRIGDCLAFHEEVV